MTGLMIKDFRLVAQKKGFWALVAVMAVYLRVVVDGTFLLTYLTMLAMICALGTLSYDEYDNGYAFLMTLPFSRRTYVREKYLFCALFGVAGWLCACVLAALPWAGQQEDLWREPEMLFGYLFAGLLLEDLLLPLQLKYGAEKSRVVLFTAAGGAAALGALFFRFFPEEALGKLRDTLPAPDDRVVFGAFAVLILAVTLLSCQISVHIMEKKEF